MSRRLVVKTNGVSSSVGTDGQWPDLGIAVAPHTWLGSLRVLVWPAGIGLDTCLFAAVLLEFVRREASGDVIWLCLRGRFVSAVVVALRPRHRCFGWVFRTDASFSTRRSLQFLARELL